MSSFLNYKTLKALKDAISKYIVISAAFIPGALVYLVVAFTELSLSPMDFSEHELGLIAACSFVFADLIFLMLITFDLGDIISKANDEQD